MKDLRHELSLWRVDWVILINLEVEFKPSSFEGSVRRPFNKTLPMKEIVINGLNENISILGIVNGHEFFVEPVSAYHLEIITFNYLVLIII